MTVNEFLYYTKTQGCNYEPIEGGNLTGMGFKIVSPKGRRYFLQIYRGGDISDKTIIQACDTLGIKYPPHLEHLMKDKE